MIKDMIFQLWANGQCFSRRSGTNVKPEYHDMKIGECRTINESGIVESFEIWRTK